MASFIYLLIPLLIVFEQRCWGFGIGILAVEKSPTILDRLISESFSEQDQSTTRFDFMMHTEQVGFHI